MTSTARQARLHLKKITKKVYIWIIGNRKAKAVAYYYDDGSRGRDILVDVLKGRNIKAMHTDGYTAYYYLMELHIDQICCGAHVWRKIKEWYERTNDPDAKMLLLDLQWLFIQEALCTLPQDLHAHMLTPWRQGQGNPEVFCGDLQARGHQHSEVLLLLLQGSVQRQDRL